MGRIAAVGFLAVLMGGLVFALVVAGNAGAETPVWTGSYNQVPNDWYVSAKDTVCSHASWKDSVVADGLHNYAVTVCTPSNSIGAGIWVNLVPLGGPDATGWMLLRDEIGIWTWEGQFAVVRLRGAGAADTSVVHYQVWVLQNKGD